MNPRELWQCFRLLPNVVLGETVFRSESTTEKTGYLPPVATGSLCESHHCCVCLAQQDPDVQYRIFQGIKNFSCQLVGRDIASTLVQSVPSERASILVWVSWSFWIILPSPHSFGLSLHTLSQVDAHLMSGLKAVSCQELNVFCWVLTAGYHQWSRICLSLPFHWDRHHLFLQVCSVYVGCSFCFQISSASTYRIKTKMKTLAGNSESINAARWSGEPAPTASLLEAPTLFQRVTEATCRALSDTLLAVNCLKATLGSRAQFHNSVNWWWLKENYTCYKTKFFTRWKMTMFPEFLEFPYMAKISVC